MRNRKTERRGAGRLTVLIAALLVAVLAAVPAAAATVTASDVMIRNSGEERNDNIIGSLNEGDKVTVISQSTDKSGIEWYYIELPNGNRGYVKAQWIDNNGEEVETSQTPAAAQQTQEEEKQPEQQDSSGQGGEAESGQNRDAAEETPAGEDADEEGIDDWTEEDAEMLNAAPVTDGSGADGAAADAQEGGESIAEGQEAPAAEEENAYNPYTDPNAQYNISFITEKDGTGSWYVYNYDTDKRIRLSDLDKMSDAEQAARKSASSAGIWRMIACILMVLLAALLIFLYLALRNTGRPSPRAGRARRRRTPVYDEDEEDDGFVYAGSRDEEPEESMTEIPGSSAEEPDRTETEEPAGETAPQEESADSDTPAGETAGEAAELTGEEQDEDVPVRPKKAGGLFGVNRKKNRKSDPEEDEEEEYEDEEYEDEEDGEDDYDEEDGGDPDDEDYDDEDYDDEDYDDGESYEDDEDEEDKIPRRGGFFGFLKNIFSSDGLEDDYEEEDEDDYDEEDYEDDSDDADEEDVEEEDETPYEEQVEEIPPARGRRRGDTGRSARQSRGSAGANRAARRRPATTVYDEAEDYPEDADLLPPVEQDVPDAGQKTAPAQRGQNAAGGRAFYETSDAAGEPFEEPDPDDFFADDDDDMDYSFLSGRAKRGNRRP